jgi:hypothetical protein
MFSWLLGAGASQSAGLPTAVDVIWDLKRRYYCSEEHQDISANDLQNSAVKEKIDLSLFPTTCVVSVTVAGGRVRYVDTHASFEGYPTGHRIIVAGIGFLPSTSRGVG